MNSDSNNKTFDFLTKYRIYLVVGAVVLLGTIFLIRSHAATSTVSVEPELGVVAGSTKVNDAGASNGQSVKFGSVAASGFVHPGILMNKTQLDFTKAKIASQTQPWANLSNTMKSYSLASLTRMPAPVATLDCVNNNPGCVAQDNDGRAAYIDALLWYYTGNTAYAKKSVEIINAWSSTLRSTSGSQAYLYSAWAADVYPRAAEILRYTYTPAAGDAQLDLPAFNAMLTNVWKPMLGPDTPQMKSSNGNWDLSMTEGLMNIAIFQDDQTTFNASLARWRARVPSYFYLSTDNSSNGIPVAPPGGLYNTSVKVQCFWLNSGSASTTCDTTNFFVANGQNQETCRDYGHVALGTASLFNAAETAHIQGVDLYGEQKTRLVAGLEYNTAIMNSRVYPTDICKGAVSPLQAIVTFPTYSIGYNHYANRSGVSMPNTLQTVLRAQAGNTYVSSAQQMIFEALTHTNTP